MFLLICVGFFLSSPTLPSSFVWSVFLQKVSLAETRMRTIGEDNCMLTLRAKCHPLVTSTLALNTPDILSSPAPWKMILPLEQMTTIGKKIPSFLRKFLIWVEHIKSKVAV